MLPDGGIEHPPGLDAGPPRDADGLGDGGCVMGATRECGVGTDVGECTGGVQTCSATGEWGECTGVVAPTAELCNGLDDDCDTVVDGPAAGLACGSAPASTSVACTAGACVVTGCAPDVGDCDGEFGNGCEAGLGTIEHCASCGDACGWDCEETSCNDAVAVDVGGSHNCAVREDGDVVCWGSASLGRLGDGSVTDRAMPGAVPGLSGVDAISSGGASTCALLSTGAVRCWGYNVDGQLGDGSTIERRTPVAVSGISSAIAVAAGASHGCALLVTGTVRCWGNNLYGQLGDGTTTNRTTSVFVPHLTGVTSITVGSGHTCALVSRGAVLCWGRNAEGQLGDGTTSDRARPTVVSGLSDGVRSIAGDSQHTCAVLESGAVRCWGYNRSGQLGDGTTTSRSVPVAVVGLTTGVAAVTAGGDVTCALLDAGGARCWGTNGFGQLGDGTTTDRATPTPVVGLGSATEIRTGGLHTCALLSSGALQCWGANANGQLGDGTTAVRTMPTLVVSP
ncbi:MAG: hypothetical protein M3Y87_04255 [Myxococcota bacterium]|nr:hypothetical protein [Myxococcota bacterium]